ncbi:hypothetical protein U2181_15240, partial [Listeria monocytogenes]|uniref:hypothetical protein n=1 Tax=Listeria monocytogenes TaxID=1639 RepID=UPI002FDBD230
MSKRCNMGNTRVKFGPCQYQEVGPSHGLSYGQLDYPDPEVFSHAPVVVRAFLARWAIFDRSDALHELEWPCVNTSGIAWER